MTENYSMTRIGLIAMAAKPLHAGHFMLIQQAARENDKALVFVSVKDRVKKGQYPIYGSQMLQVWKILETIMPSNAEIMYVDNPIQSIYKHIGHQEEAIKAGEEPNEEYKVYSDPVDLAANYPTKSMIKYFSNMWMNGLLTLQPITRTSTVNVSGTQMRKWLADANVASFIENLPQPLSQTQRLQIWDILTQSNTTI